MDSLSVISGERGVASLPVTSGGGGMANLPVSPSKGVVASLGNAFVNLTKRVAASYLCLSFQGGEAWLSCFSCPVKKMWPLCLSFQVKEL